MRISLGMWYWDVSWKRINGLGWKRETGTSQRGNSI